MTQRVSEDWQGLWNVILIDINKCILQQYPVKEVTKTIVDGSAVISFRHRLEETGNPKFRSLKVRSAVSGRDASCRINGLAETPERFHENAVVSRFPTYGF